MEKEVWKDQDGVRTDQDGPGPAEAAVAAYFASRKQNRISESAVSALCSNMAEPGKGLAVLSPQSGTRPAPVPELRS